MSSDSREQKYAPDVIVEGWLRGVVLWRHRESEIRDGFRVRVRVAREERRKDI